MEISLGLPSVEGAFAGRVRGTLGAEEAVGNIGGCRLWTALAGILLGVLLYRPLATAVVATPLAACTQLLIKIKYYRAGAVNTAVRMESQSTIFLRQKC